MFSTCTKQMPNNKRFIHSHIIFVYKQGVTGSGGTFSFLSFVDSLIYMAGRAISLGGVACYCLGREVSDKMDFCGMK